jgi:hypothetical protein
MKEYKTKMIFKKDNPNYTLLSVVEYILSLEGTKNTRVTLQKKTSYKQA